jgi:hypothetical protein
VVTIICEQGQTPTLTGHTLDTVWRALLHLSIDDFAFVWTEDNHAELDLDIGIACAMAYEAIRGIQNVIQADAKADFGYHLLCVRPHRVPLCTCLPCWRTSRLVYPQSRHGSSCRTRKVVSAPDRRMWSVLVKSRSTSSCM